MFVLDTYMEKLPAEAIARDNFYVQPCMSALDDPQKLWFTSQPIGKNTLGKMVKGICSDGGINGQKSNHSLCATGASDLYQAGVPEKLIQERTGHLSTDGLRHYECTTVSQQWAVSRIISCTDGTMYQRELQPHPIATVQAPLTPAPLMNFTGCNVTIYNGPITLPTPVLPQSDLFLSLTDFEQFSAEF